MKRCASSTSLFTNILAVVILILLIVFALYLFRGDDYYKESGWDCNPEDFRNRYSETIDNKIAELQKKYSIECEKTINPNHDTIIEYHLYDDTFTINLLFGPHSEYYSDFEADLYYYGSDESDLDDYSKQENLLNFLDEIVCYFGHDTKKGRFESLYSECLENHKLRADDLIHQDDLVGDIRYEAWLKRESDTCGYHYRAEHKGDVIKTANFYQFKGLMKGDLN